MNKYTKRRKKWDIVKKDDPLQSFGLAEMEFGLDKEVQQEIVKYLDQSVMGYAQAPASYYEAIGNWMRKNYNENVENEDIVITSGVVPAIKAFIEIQTEPNKKIALFTPAYNNFYKAIEDTGRSVEEIELDYDNGKYTIDFDQTEEVLAQDDVELLIICSPHNPVGRVWTKEELEKIYELGQKHNVAIVSDEIHGDLIFDDVEFTSLLDFDLNIPVCTSGSKTFNIAGFKTSNIIIKDESLRAEFEEYLDKHDLAGNSAVGLFGTEKSYELSEDWLIDKLDIIQENVRLVEEMLSDTKVVVTEQNSTFLMWLDFKYYLDKNPKFFELLEDHGIYYSEGTMYGDAGEGFARVNIGTETAEVEKMVHALLKVLEGVENGEL